MPSLIDLRRRVRAVKNTQQITKAMKMVAASKLRRAQERITNARPYAVQMQHVLAGLAGRVDASVHPLLTTAEELSDRTLVRVQKGGRGKWWNAEVVWIDYHANLAVLTASDATLWAGLKPAAFVTCKPPKDGLQIGRWRNGNLETRKAEFNQFIVEDARLSFIQHLQLECSTEMQGVGWAEPLVAGPGHRRQEGRATMCRSITPLRGLEPPATADEVRAAAYQYVRKVAATDGRSAPTAAAVDAAEPVVRWT